MILKMIAKCSDMFNASLHETDDNGRIEKQVGKMYNGYVPGWFGGGCHYGDYIDLDIDIKTGRIVNWRVPGERELKRTFQIKA